MRWLAYIGIAIFLLFFAVGYSYFYPSSSPLGRDEWFSAQIVPTLDAWLVSGRTGTYSGRLVRSQGELKYKSDSDFVFYPVRGAQRFYGKTMISSGVSANASIEVGQGVRLQIESNSVLVIEPEVEGEVDGPTVRVIAGAVVAKADVKTPVSAKKVRMVTSSGKSRVVDQKGVAVVADGKGYIGELPNDIKQLRDSYVSQNAQVIERERLLKAEAAKAEVLRQQDLAKRMQEFTLQATETQETRATASAAESTVAVEVPQKILRRKFNAELAATVDKVEPQTSVARGLYQAKRGQKAEATRSFASALSSPLYGASDAFSPSVQMALDGMLEAYESSGRCALARDTIANALRQYSGDAFAQAWGLAWQRKLAAKNNQQCL